MFDVVAKGFKNARLKLQGKRLLTEGDVTEALKEVRKSLIQADVEIGVIKDFVDSVKERTLGSIVSLTNAAGQQATPGEHFIAACHDELVALMGPVDATLDLSGSPTIVMMVGLQGSGKTTTSGKLAKMLLEQGKKPLLVAADIYRPAAIDQLMVVGRKLGVPVFSIKGMKPVQLAKMAVVQAKNVGRDVVIIDTAGRLAIDNSLMDELVDMKAAVDPDNILFVCDAMMGQDAVQTADSFDDRLDFSGFIMTKLDGDARGGAALSIKAVTGKPIKFLGKGEALADLEEFRPEGLAQRILGMGDVVGLMKDFEKHVDQETAVADAQKMMQGEFSYDDFVRQLQQIRKMGPLKEIFSRLPGLSSLMDKIPEEAFDDRELDRTLAIINSMTRQERTNPSVMNDSRFRRIATGCGRTFSDVSDLHNRFLQAREMMKGMGNMMGNPNAMAQAQQMMGGGGGGFPGMGGGFPGMGGGLPGMGGGLPGMGGFPGVGGGGGGNTGPTLSAEEKIKLRKQRKAARKARKKNRKNKK